MKRKPICILVAHLFAATAAPALAQSTPPPPDDFRVTGTVGIGGMAVDDDAKDASKLNEYMDLSSGVLSNFDIHGRGSRHWFDLFGENIARDDQYIALRGGMYDVFKYRVSSDSLRHNFLYNGITPYAGAGSPLHTATFPSLDPTKWNSLDIGYKRRNDAATFEYQGADPWYLRVEGNQVKWSGSKPGAASQGTSPGNGFVDLAFPVEYVTRNLGVEAGYKTRKMHLDVSLMTSKFENDNETVDWTNGYFKGVDRTYLAPDNKYTRLASNATFRQLPMATTVAARYTSDELTSDVPLGTAMLGSGGQNLATGPSTDTFHGKVTNQTFTLSATSAPMKALDTRVYYNYRKRDDESTQVTFTSTADVGPYHSEPFSYTKDNYGFDAFFRINRGNRIGGGYDYLDTEREGRFDYDRTKDRRLFLEWKNTTLDELAARLKYTRLERESNFLLANSGTNSNDVNYLNRFVTAFDLSNVDQDQWKLTLDWSPIPHLDFGFEGIIKTNKYKDNTLGRLKDDRREIYLNASYALPGGSRFTLFGDSEEIKYDSTHRIIGSGTTSGAYDPATAPTSSNYNWGGKIKDRNYAFGAAFDWPATDRIAIKASVIYYKTDGSVDLALQEGVPASVTRPLPIADWDDTKRTSFTLKAVYNMSKAWSFTGGYAYERYEYKDAQFDGYRYTIPAATGQDSYLDGVYANPKYKASFLYMLASYRF